RPQGQGAARARSQPHRRLPAAGRLRGHVPLRARERLSVADVSRLSEGAELASSSNPPRYLFTGLSRLINSATRSLICSIVRILLVPKRGMFEHANVACEL